MMKNKLLYFIYLYFFSILQHGYCQQGHCEQGATRIDCYPEGYPKDMSPQEACKNRECTYCEDNEMTNGPNCVLSTNYGYKLQTIFYDNITEGIGASFGLVLSPDQPLYVGTVKNIMLTVTFESNYRFNIKITDGSPTGGNRWQVPVPVSPPGNPATDDLRYTMEYNKAPEENSPFWFRIVRNNPEKTILFDTSLGGLTFSDQFIQITTLLATKNLYGIGENEQSTFRHDFDKGYENNVYPLYARDQPPAGNGNMYGVQPYYTVLENDGLAHSIAILNSNAQEFVVLPTPALTYRTTGGILHIYGFVGNNPEETVQFYTEGFGRYALPPYWSLGYHLCRYGYADLDEIKEVVERTALYNIPHDVQYGDIDIMDREMDFTINQDKFGELPHYVIELKQSKNIKFITILDPAIAANQIKYRPFDYGQELDVWTKNSDGTPLVGKVWPGNQTYPVFFPDYSNPNTQLWWKTLIEEFHTELEFDGLWIDMNEPANFVAGDWNKGCPVNKWNNPPYMPNIFGGFLAEKTICPDCKEHLSVHYNTHSLYGYFQTEPTFDAVRSATGKRGLTLSRSTFLGSGKFIAHWLGDNYSQWSNLHRSIIGMLSFNHFGIPHVGADICGFFEETTPELCRRWSQLGAFYPFSRNHNALGNGPQDPGFFGPEIAGNVREALEIRYSLLPYLYTLFYAHFTEGSTVVRALWHQFPTDPNTFGIDKQFLWGSGLLITPVLEQDELKVEGYFPAEGRFYNLHSPTRDELQGDGFLELDAPLNIIPVHFVGGNILITQDPAVNTVLSRKNNLNLIVALDHDQKASGSLFWDDGESQDSITLGNFYFAKFEYNAGTISTAIDVNGLLEEFPTMATIEFLGLSNKVIGVHINGNEVGQDSFTSTETYAKVFDQTIDLSDVGGFELTLTFETPAEP